MITCDVCGVSMFPLARWFPEGIAKRTGQFVFGHNLQIGIDTTIRTSDRETDFEGHFAVRKLVTADGRQIKTCLYRDRMMPVQRQNEDRPETE